MLNDHEELFDVLFENGADADWQDVPFSFSRFILDS